MQPAEEDWGAVHGAIAPSLLRRRLGDGWRWLAANFIAERERWALWLPAFVGVGAGIYFWLTVEPSLWLGPVAVALTVPVAIIAYRRQSGALPAIAAAAIALGFAAASFEAWWVAAPILAHKLTAVWVEGRVVAVDPQPEGTRLVLEPRHIDRLDDGQRPARIRVKLRQEEASLLPGEWIKLRA